MEILLATHNKGKVKEIETMLSNKNINLKCLNSFTKISPKENGKTFKENATIKAISASNKTGWRYDCLSDDSGLCIEELNESPGIHSSRWAKKNYREAFMRIERKFKRIGKSMVGKRARFVCCLVFLKKDKKKFFYEGLLEGSLIYPHRGNHGFGYDHIFIPDGEKKTLAELGKTIKNKISHRKKALDKFIEENCAY